MDQPAEILLHESWMPILTDPVRLSLLRGLCRLEVATTAELRDLSHSSDPTIRRHLAALEALGIIRERPPERDGVTPGRPAKRYMLDPGVAIRLFTLFQLLSEPLVPAPAPEQLPRPVR